MNQYQTTRPDIFSDPSYATYHTAVIDAIKRSFVRRFGQPKTIAEQEQFDRNVRFFDEQCTYDDEWRRGDDPGETAEDNIDSADWS